ncbi:MAG: protein kinase [Planctomycetota bacterium]
MPKLPQHPRYELVDTLGRGAFGVVYRAIDREDGSAVALKTLDVASAGDREDLEREIQALRGLRHPGIARLLDVDELDGQLFFTMELVEGFALDALLGNRPTTAQIERLLEASLQALAALGSIHERGWIHGDLKPSNLRIATKSSEIEIPATPELRVVDFGLARSAGLAGRTEGTLLYLPPEQLGRNPIDERADLYSLGALLYHLIAGEPPFADWNAAFSHNRNAPRPLLELNSAASTELSACVERLLERNPGRRPSSAGEVAETLRSILRREEGSAAAPCDPRFVGPTFVGREIELDALRRSASRLSSDCGAAVVIEGPSGSGKTWLVRRSGIKGEWLLDHRCAYLELSFDGQSDLASSSAILRDVFARATPDGVRPEDWTPAFLEAAGQESHATNTEALPRAIVHEQIFEGTSRAFRRASKQQPIVVFFDNAHVADEFGVSLMGRVATLRADCPVLVLIAARRESVTEGSPLAQLLVELDSEERVSLSGFSDGELGEFVHANLEPPAPPNEEALEYLGQQSAGLPALAQQWLRVLWDRNALSFVGGEWRIDDRNSQSDDLWNERRRALPAEALKLLLAVSVSDADFDANIASRLWESIGGRGPATPALRTLVQSGALVETPLGYEVAADVDRDDLDRSRPKQLHDLSHRVFVDELRERDPYRSARTLARIARHLEAIGERNEASAVFEEAGSLALSTHAIRFSLEAFESALAIEQRGALLLKKGSIQARLGDYDAAQESLRSAVDITESQNDETAHLDALDQLGRVLQRRRDLDGAESSYRRCLFASEEGSSTRQRAHLRLAGIHFDRGDYEYARREFEQSIRETSSPTSMTLTPAYTGLGLIAKQERDWDQSLEWFERALSEAKNAGNALETATILGNLANLSRARGAVPEAAELLRKSIDLRVQIGDRHGRAICLNNLARIEFDRGQVSASNDSTEDALKNFSLLGDTKGILIALCNLAECAVVLGRFDQASERLAEARKLAERAGARRIVEAAEAQRARMDLIHGEAAVAEQRLRTLRDDLPGHDLSRSTIACLCEALLAQSRMEDVNDYLHDGEEDDAEWTLVRMRWHSLRRDPEIARMVGEDYLRSDNRCDLYSRARVERELGCVFRELGPDWADRTERYLENSRRAFEEIRSPHESAESIAEIAVYWHLQGESEIAAEALSESQALFRTVGLEGRANQLEEQLS